MPISSLGVIFRLKSIMRKYLEKCKTYKIKPLLKNQHPLFVWSDMIRFFFKKVPFLMSSEITDLHMNYFLTTVPYQIFFFLFPRSMKFNHLEVSLVLLCYIYLMKWNGLWLRFWHSLLSPKPEGYILSIRGKKNIRSPCAPSSYASSKRKHEEPPFFSHLESALLLTAKDCYFYYLCR